SGGKTGSRDAMIGVPSEMSSLRCQGDQSSFGLDSQMCLQRSVCWIGMRVLISAHDGIQASGSGFNRWRKPGYDP
ncbi:hypothetical protein NPIL_402351, partial [Nephila pilipes]